jgi:hypothetical protein
MSNKSNGFLVSVQRQKGNFFTSLDTNEQVRKIGEGVGVAPEPNESVSRNVLQNKCWKMAKKNSIISPMIDYAESVNSPNLIQYRSVLLCGRYLLFV